MRKGLTGVLLVLAMQCAVVARAHAFDHSKTRPKNDRLTLSTKLSWVPVLDEAKINLPDNMIASIFVEKGSLAEYQQTGLWPKGSQLLLRMRNAATTTGPKIVVEVAYKKNPKTEQWESYSVQCSYEDLQGQKPARRGINPRCSAVQSSDFM